MERENSELGAALGAIGVLTAAAILVAVRGHVSSTNVALALVVFVLLAGVAGGRVAGATTALVAAMSFDFFHTVPYNSLKIADRNDIETAVMLLVIGLVVGEIGAWTRRTRLVLDDERRNVRRIHGIAERAATGEHALDLVPTVTAELVDLLQLRTCRFEAVPFEPPLPAMVRGVGKSPGSIRRRDLGLAFSAPVMELAVLFRGTPYGRFVLETTPGVPVSQDRRLTAVSLTDQLGAALAQGSASPVR
jgi:hypothetical protein